jgi:ABC-type glycerol-3-phosphate transport system substrate-binding protein
MKKPRSWLFLMLALVWIAGCGGGGDTPEEPSDDATTPATDEGPPAPTTDPSAKTETVEEAVAALEELGAKITFDGGDKSKPIVVNLEYKTLTDDDLSHFKPLATVEEIDLRSTAMT